MQETMIKLVTLDTGLQVPVEVEAFWDGNFIYRVEPVNSSAYLSEQECQQVKVILNSDENLKLQLEQTRAQSKQRLL